MANDIEIKIKLEDQASKPIGTVNDSLKSIGTTAEQTSKKTSSFAENFKSNWLVVSASITAVIGSLKSFVDAQAAAEKSSAKLTAALKNQGVYSEELQKSIEDYSSSLQRVTLYADDQITAVQTMLVTAGLFGSELKRTTKLTLDFAAATGQDVESAGFLFQKAAQGNVTMLQRYGIETKNADGSTKSFSEILDVITKKYNGFSQAVANTPSGKLVQLSNAFGDLKENLGLVVLTAMQPFVEFATKMLYFILGMPAPLKFLIATLIVLGITLAGLIPIIGLFGATAQAAFLSMLAPIASVAIAISLFFSLIYGLNKISPILAGLAIAFQLFWAAASGGIIPLITGIIALIGWLGKLTGVFNKMGLFKGVKNDTPITSKIKNTDADSNKSIDLKKNLDDFTKTEMQKTNVLKTEINKRQMSEQQFNDWLASENLQKAENDLKTTDAKIAALEMFHSQEMAKYQNNAAMKAQIDILYNEQKLALEQERINQENALRDAQYLADKQRMTSGLQSFIDMLDLKKKMTKSQAEDFAKWQNFMAGAESSKNSEVAAISKAMAIYDIGIKTANAAVGAYSAMAGIPFVGPVLGAAAAAAAISYGGEQVSKVQSMQPALAEGGMLRSTAGGRSVTVAEGGNDEAVVPLDDPATAQRLQNAVGGGSGQTIQLVVDNMVLAETVVQGYNKGQNIGRVTRLK